MRTLTVLYDGTCPLCVESSRWLTRSRQRIPLRVLDVHGEVAHRTYGRVPGDGRALVVVDDAGRYWAGPAAFLMCLWALKRWALFTRIALLRPLRPLTLALFALVSANRSAIAAVLGVRSSEDGHLGVAPHHGGPYRSARARVSASGSNMGVEAPGWHGANEEDTGPYLTSSERRQPGWIGIQNEQVVGARALGLTAR